MHVLMQERDRERERERTLIIERTGNGVLAKIHLNCNLEPRIFTFLPIATRVNYVHRT